MRSTKALPIALAVLAAAAAAQVDYESFPVPGSPIAGWTQSGGTWTVRDTGGGDLRAESSATNGDAFLLRTGSQVIMGVIEAKLTGVSDLTGGGVVLAWNGSNHTGVSAMGVSSGGTARYAVLMLTDAGGASTLVNLLPSRTKEVTVRLLLHGTEARAQFDVEPLDGKWDHELGLWITAPTAAPYGGYAWKSSWLDNVKFFDAAIFRRSTFGASNLGQTVNLDLYAPTASARYVLVASLAKGMVRIPNGWYAPIVPDALTAAVPLLPGVFSGFSGTLNASGVATVSVHVPSVPALAGTAIFLSGVVLDSQPAPRLLHVFNDERLDLKS